MGLDDILRNGIALAHRITGDLQVQVQHSAWIGTDVYGKNTYAAAVDRRAIVDYKQRLTRQLNGQEIVQVATITFLEPIEDNGAEGRREPVDTRDRMVLPNGQTGPIVEVSGPMDPNTSNPYMLTVGLGAQSGAVL